MNAETMAIWQRLADVHADAAVSVTMAWMTLPLALAMAAHPRRR